MKNGLYKVVFRTSLAEGAGVVVLKDGRLLGGDSSFSYIGTYREEDNTFTASVETRTHTIVPGRRSALGAPHAVLALSGAIYDDEARMTGRSPSAPGVKFFATLRLLTN